MVFTSFEYLLFLPIVFVLYWVVFSRSNKLQNIFLTIISLIFYGLIDWRFLSLLVFTVLISFYIPTRFKECPENKNTNRFWLISGVVLNLAILLYFKYFNFFVQSVVDFANVFGANLSYSTIKIILPVGISFYTFSALSYIIDVYQSKVKASNDFFAFAAFVTFFPSLLSGPISRAQQQLPQYFEKRDFRYEMMSSAFKAVVWGLFMKVCVADRLGIYVDTIYSNIDKHSGSSLFLAQLLYTIQIYADFAGYSLMAIGSGRFFGVELTTNFLRPYFATTITEFWRKWHISLTTWFRDYIYFPLGGNRVSKVRWIFNTIVVFTVSGIWHGAAYTFIIWGLLHGLLMVAERLVYGSKIKHLNEGNKCLNLVRWLITFNLISLVWIFFRANTLSDALTIIARIFTSSGGVFIDAMTMIAGFMSLSILIIKDIADEYGFEIKNVVVKRCLTYGLYCALICYILLFGVFDGGQFIYFQF